VTSCEKLRGDGEICDPEMSDWGDPTVANNSYRIVNS